MTTYTSCLGGGGVALTKLLEQRSTWSARAGTLQQQAFFFVFYISQLQRVNSSLSFSEAANLKDFEVWCRFEALTTRLVPTTAWPRTRFQWQKAFCGGEFNLICSSLMRLQHQSTLVKKKKKTRWWSEKLKVIYTACVIDKKKKTG